MTGRDRLLVFGIALTLRLAAGWIFFGSVDIQKSLDLAHHILAGQAVEMRGIPYLPSIGLFLWGGAWIAVHTDWPLAFGFKLAPIFADSLLAVLVGDLAGRRKPEAAKPAAWLHALCPLGTVIVSLHGQWDPIALLFMALAAALAEAEPRRPFLAGLLLFVSVAVKPMGLLFLPLLVLLPERGRALGGFTLAAAATIALLTVLGFDLEWTLLHAFTYGAVGWFSFGLPKVLGVWAEPRLWLALPMAVVYLHFLRRRLDMVEAVALGFLGVVAISGLAPQYLLWPLPFLLAAGHPREGALLTGAATVFLAFYYVDPWSTEPYFAHTPVLATLEFARPLMPPAWAADGRWGGLLAGMGNLLLPLLALGLFIRIAARPERIEASLTAAFLAPRVAAALLPFLAAGIGLAWAGTGDAAAFDAAVKAKIGAYALACPTGIQPMKHIVHFLCPLGTPVPAYGPSWALNAFTFLPLWGLAWAWAAWRRG